ncbi:DNA-binding response regulator [Salibacterium salarium]|uniref:DNA-binding response regulator n=1 Tax=Salibacterium salarium TaxID=284579 RepID=A0A428MUP5_9BACI|nr:response regulator transcription factor [Salibacterium salarium]RSL29840.1 DNA-binding response regulator [Salibacterium salarium]
MEQTILVVEDDPMIRDLVRLYLENDGHEVYTCSDGEQAVELVVEHEPCLLVLDLMLPKKSGEEVCQWMRDSGYDAAVLMLTAKVSSQEKIDGLKMGADDYMIKPFSPEELAVRVQSILRRTGHICQKITYSGLTIKPRKGEVSLHGEIITLTKIEFTLLYYFMRHPHTICSRDVLTDQIYPNEESVITDRTIDVHIKHLREKLEARRFLTVRGMGYKFVT